jgi:hypothetical protein
METFIELVKILGPALIVLYAVYLTIRSFFNSRLEEIRAEARKLTSKEVVGNRLQAYERITLLLERIAPGNIVSRLSHKDFTAREFQSMLINEIRQEYHHNLSQQVYMSDQSWAYVQGAVEDTISTINEVANGLAEDAKGIDLAMKIFEKTGQNETDSRQNALSFIKSEVREIF